MILVVDDDPTVLRAMERVLVREGYAVESCSGAAEALARSGEVEPDLIISDVRMPGMDGLDLRAAYTWQYPHRQTPFVFLSAMADTAHVIRGLEAGADDYLAKPFVPQVFVAKVQALLRRQGKPAVESEYRGRLEELPVIDLWQFCARMALTGEVTISAPDGFEATLPFEGGELTMDDASASDTLSTLLDLEAGAFVIHSRSVGFNELRISEVLAARSPSHAAPACRLSTVRVDPWVFEIKTSFETSPLTRVVSVVALDGQVLATQTIEPKEGSVLEDVNTYVEELHRSVEAMVRQRPAELVEGRQAPAASTIDKERCLRLALDLCRNTEYEGALIVLEKALSAFPGDRVVQANMDIVRQKMAAA